MSRCARLVSMLSGNLVVTMGISLAALLAIMPAAQAVIDSMTVTDKSATTQTNYPLQFARPFVQGEIASYPQVLVNGTPVTTQADVKQRWPDGSVKHAILSLLVPSIPASGSVTLTFQNQPVGNNTPLTQSDMLAPIYDFDAVLRIASGSETRAASARTMLTNNSFTYWTQGPIATTILLADHSATRTYDIGFDSIRSIRPLFEVTFWPGINKVRVRFIGENCCSEAMEDVGYDITLTMGLAAPQTVYTKTGHVHKAATRWTKVFWLGGAPESRVNVDSNVAYLAQTRFVPMYDATLTVPESTISGDYAKWLTTARDIQDGAWWCKYMPTTGGRHDIGHMPKWSTQWLYTGDWRSREIAFGHADLASNWPLQVREGKPTKLYDRAQTIAAIGRPVSICARPGLWLLDGRDASDPDWIPIQGTTIATPGGVWTNDNAHQPDPFSVQYILTGEHWYLEQLQMWAAFDALSVWPDMRGPAGCAGIVDQVRGNAWMFRTRVNAAFLSPDGTPEKDYFTTIVNDAIAHWDGWHGVAGAFMQSVPWKWAKGQVGVSYGLSVPPPLHYFETGDNSRNDFDSTVDGLVSPWQEYMVMMELGIAHEKGFATTALATWYSQGLTRQFYDPGYSVYHLAEYRHPVHLTAGTWLTTWAQVEQVLVAQGRSDAQALADFTNGAGDTTHGYPVIATAAAAQNYNLPDGDLPWSFLKANVRDANRTSFAADPKWAINPRGNILQVGSGKTYATVQAAVDAAGDWDTIQIFPGTYTQGAGGANIAKNNLTFVGMGSPRPVLDAAGSCLGGKGVFVITGHDTTVRNLEFANARNTTSKIAAGIRLQGANLTVSGCYFHDSDNGMLADSIGGSAISIDSSEFYHNGTGDGLGHNINIGIVDSFTLKYCWVHNANGGCEVRTHARTNTILYSRIGNEGGSGTYEIQAASGGTTWIIGNQIEQSAVGGHATIVDYASEGASPDMHLYVVNNTVVNNRTDGTFVNNAGTTSALLQNNIFQFQGTGTVLSGPGTQTTNWATSSASLRDAAHYDFRLTPGSTDAINTGTIPGTAAGLALTPVCQYVHPCSYENRATGSAIDIGAYKSTPPIVVNAGTNQVVFLPAVANLSGSASGGGGPLTYTWSKVSGPNTVVFADPSAAVTTATFGASGMYVLQLAASDGFITGTGTVTISVDPPAVVTNLAASNPTPNGLTLTWTAPGDVGTTGTAASYEIRYSTTAITDINFASATKLASPPAPTAAGTSQNVTVSGLSSSTVYYFALKTTSQAGVVSAISNVPSGLTAPAIGQTAPVLVDFETPTDPNLFTGSGANAWARVAAHGSYAVKYNSGNGTSYRKYAPGGNDYPVGAGRFSTDLDVFYDDTSTHGAAAYQGGLLLQAKTPGTEQYEAILKVNASAGTVTLWVGNIKSSGHTAAVSVPAGTFTPNTTAITDIGWYHMDAVVSTDASGNYKVVVTATDPALNVYTATYVDSGTAKYTAPYPVGYYDYNQWNTYTYFDNFQIVPDPAAPAPPQMGTVTSTTVLLLSLGSQNDATTEYLVQEATTGLYVGPNGRLQPAPFWQARQAWVNTVIWGLNSATACQFKSKARNSLAVESSYSPAAIVTTSIAGDINGDTCVNVGDLQSLVAAWASSSTDGGTWSPAADLNNDSHVNIGDLQILAANWGRG